jgi:hypothetical protein
MPALAIATALVAFAGTANAALITWSSNYTLMENSGNAANAYAQLIPGQVIEAKQNFGTSTITVNETLYNRSIAFEYFVPAGGGGNFGTSGLNTGNSQLNQALTNGHQGDGGTGSLTITLGGLTSGTGYYVQIWSHSYQMAVKGGEAVATGYDPPGGGSDSIPSWFTVGTFTADATTQTVTLSRYGDPLLGRPQIDAYMVTVIPEPASMGMLGATAIALLLRRRFRR